MLQLTSKRGGEVFPNRMAAIHLVGTPGRKFHFLKMGICSYWESLNIKIYQLEKF